MIKEEIPVWCKTFVVPTFFLRTEYINRFVMASADENPCKRKLDQGDIRALMYWLEGNMVITVKSDVHVRR